MLTSSKEEVIEYIQTPNFTILKIGNKDDVLKWLELKESKKKDVFERNLIQREDLLDFTFINRTENESNTPVDEWVLTENLKLTNVPKKCFDKFLKESRKILKNNLIEVYCDASISENTGFYGIVFYKNNNIVYKDSGEIHVEQQLDSNIAELYAIVRALELALLHNLESTIIYTDSIVAVQYLSNYTGNNQFVNLLREKFYKYKLYISVTIVKVPRANEHHKSSHNMANLHNYIKNNKSEKVNEHSLKRKYRTRAK